MGNRQLKIEEAASQLVPLSMSNRQSAIGNRQSAISNARPPATFRLPGSSRSV
jgi:hypothetical protein